MQLPAESELRLAMQADRFRLRRQLRQLREGLTAGRDIGAQAERLRKQLAESQERRARRIERRPAVTFDGGLPIDAHREAIADALQRHSVVVICGETGSGKSTQLPKICLDLGRGVDGLIGHTQPRRLAARAISTRIAQELGVAPGTAVGHKIRFADETGPDTYIKLMTDGVLLAETQHDKFLDQYDTLIIDEAHERSLNIDFLLGYLKRLLPRRPDLRVIITSATIDIERFRDHFSTAESQTPVIEVSGRVYPVEVRYRPAVAESPDDEPDLERALVDAVDEACREGQGDLLVFLPTERDIREAARSLRGWATGRPGSKSLEILPLYARLSNAEQQRVFQPHAGRRIVLATNVAESSLTVPGIRFVVDTGTARISRYSPRSKVRRLPVEPVSQASADQRKGRCGRIGPGICIRIYSEEDYLGRDRFTTPEIRRTDLASVVLQTEVLRLGRIDEFPFLDPPRTDAVRDGYKTLFELNAVDSHQRVTELGRRLARLPVDLRIGRMVLAADEQHCLAEALIITSALELQDPRERPVDKRQQADEAHAKHAHPESDFLALLKLWDFYHELRRNLSRSQLRKALRQNFLSATRMQEWLDIHRQLRDIVAEAGLHAGRREDKYEPIHRALLTGLLSNVAVRGEGHEYQSVGGMFFLWPGSSVFAKRPPWVMAAEMVETTRRYLRMVARIDPEWIVPAAAHLVKRSHSDPHWSDSNGSAMTYEKVTLWGLTVSSRRRVPLAPVDPKQARELLIRHGLSEGRLKGRFEFLEHNRAALARMEELAARTRRRDLLIHDTQLWDWFDSRLPEEIGDPARLRGWLDEERRAGRTPLHLSVDELLVIAGADTPTAGGAAEVSGQQEADSAVAPARGQRDSSATGGGPSVQAGVEAPRQPQAFDQSFPDQLAIDGLRLPLSYRFQPGEADDGVSVAVPRAVLGQLNEQRLGWLIPGLVEEKILALIRALPKSLRRNFVPAPDTARRVAGELEYGQGAFLDQVAARLSAIAGERVRPEDFPQDKLPEHLRLHIKVLDDSGQTLAAGRDLGALRTEVGADSPAPFTAIDDEQWGQRGLTDWTFGELPERIVVRRGSIEVPAFPALIDEGDSAALRLLDTADAAERESRRGARRLFAIQEKRELSSQVKWLPGLERLAVLGAGLPDRQRLREELADLLATLALFHGTPTPPLPRTAEEFAQRRQSGRRAIPVVVQEVAEWIGPLLEHYHQLRLKLETLKAPSLARVATDVREQLSDLVAAGFLSRVPWCWLRHFPRYLRAACVRLDKLQGGGQRRDEAGMEQLAPFLKHWRSVDPARAERADHQRFRWLIEEFRVSLFAQELGTSETISAKRLEKQWESLER